MKKEYFYIPIFILLNLIAEITIMLFFRNKIYYMVASVLFLIFIGFLIGLEKGFVDNVQRKINKYRLFLVIIPLIILIALLTIPYILQYSNIISSSKLPYILNILITTPIMRESSSILLGYFIATIKKE